MIAETVRLLWTWVRVTLALTLICGVILAVYGFGSVPFTLAAAGAGLVELVVIRRLAREWSFQASGCWWWSW